MKPTLLFCLLGPLALGCSADSTSDADPATSDPCADARAHLQSCFPDQPLPTECHAESAEAILNASCEELSRADGKADGGWMCIWMPWLCTGSGSSTRGISVIVERCAGYYGSNYDCYGTYGSPCTLVVLEDATGQELQRGYTGTYGSVRFDVTSNAAHVVRILDREGQTATQVVGDLTYSPAEARTEVPAKDEDQTVRMYVPTDSEPALKFCSSLRGNIDVTDNAGQRLDAEEIEWSWVVRFLAEDGTVGLGRPGRRHPEVTASGEWENVFEFPHGYAGEHLFEFVRVDVPSYARVANPDYERLLNLYAVSSVDPERVSLEVTPEEIPEPVVFTHSFLDPLAP